MKLHATPLLLAFGLAISAALPGHGHAQSVTAFGSFHVQSATVLPEGQYTCLTEDNGAVVNNCGIPVNLFFNLPVLNAGEKIIAIRDYWSAPYPFVPFNCVSYAYTGEGSSSTMGTQVTFEAPRTIQRTSDDVVNEGDTLSVICWQVPPKEGIASLKLNE